MLSIWFGLKIICNLWDLIDDSNLKVVKSRGGNLFVFYFVFN